MALRNCHRVPWLLAWALVLNAPARAQETRNPSPPDVVRLVAARRVLDASCTVNVMVAAMRANLPA